MPAWKRIQDPEAGYIHELSDSLALLDWRYPGLLQPVSDGIMVVASDYSGQHQGATHEAYSFLVTTDHALVEWEPIWRAFRNRWLPDGRRISFKRLGERVRWRALLPFLDVAGMIRGNVITILIDRRIQHFMEGGTAVLANVFPDCFSPDTPSGTIEKMFRLASFLAMLTAGFRREDQRSLWVSDHDETLETFGRREQFARLSTYLTFGVTGWRHAADSDFCTTEHSHAPAWAEDLSAIPDLFAGACCQFANLIPAFCGTELWMRVFPSTSVADPRARTIGNWLSVMRNCLRHVFLRLELDQTGVPRTSAQFFAGAAR